MKIITPVTNNPDFIEIQYKTFLKYLNIDFEFIVFNDSKKFPDWTNYNDISIYDKIISKCSDLNIKCINIDNDHHKNIKSGSLRHVDSLNFILKYQLKNPDEYLIIDSDLFLIDYLDINKYNKYSAVVIIQERSNKHYMWPGLCYLNMNKISNIELLNWDLYNGSDTGGMMYKFLYNEININDIPDGKTIRYDKNFINNNDKILFLKHLWSCTWDINELPDNLKKNKNLIKFLNDDPRNKNNKFFCEIYDNVFFHYRAGCNWLNEGHDIHNKLTNNLKNLLLN